MSPARLQLDEEMLRELAGSGPRYTSYPTAPEWRDDFGPTEALDAYARAGESTDEPLAVYVHVPFCEKRCLFCGCTVHITNRHDRGDVYLDALEREVALVAGALGDRRGVEQLHWGGGTPTFLSVPQLQRLHGIVAGAFDLLPGAEQSVEIHPHVTTLEQIDALCELGFNRVSMGVQDFDPHVQDIVHRYQTVEETTALIERCREHEVDGINLDLLYGLPDQTEDGFARTLEIIAGLRPERLAVYGYAHVPWLKRTQTALERFHLPDPVERARLFGLAIERLGSAGYRVIGLDHFALPDDALSRSLDEGGLHRNFMGYTTQRAEDMLGLGMSSIGEVAGTFLQNERETAPWQDKVVGGELATVRGLRRNAEDELRRAAILALMCRMRIDLDELERRFGRDDLAEHFAREWRELEPHAERGLCTIAPRRVEVTETGRLFLRHMAMVFDSYLRKKREGSGPRFSGTV